jgi:GST-like protein
MSSSSSTTTFPPRYLEDLFPSTANNKFINVNSDTAGPRIQQQLPFCPIVPINLYTLGTPNGQKAAIMLEELNLEYVAHPIDILIKQEQFTSGFVKVNPNSRIPCILVDYGKTRVFESGAILVFLADVQGKLIPKIGDPKRAECLSWVFWQMAGQGPMFGNFGHFFKYAPRDKIDVLQYGTARYGMEVRRLLSVLENHLKEHHKTWILGDEFSIADIACYPWTETIETGYGAGEFIGITVGRYPSVSRWMERMRKRPGVARGMCVCAGKKKAMELVQLNVEHVVKNNLLGQGNNNNNKL